MVEKSDLPSFEKYFPPTVHAMRSRGGSATIEELEDDVAKQMNLPETLLAIPHKSCSRSQFGYELAWVRTYLKKAGLAENSERGVWSLTEAGEKISDLELLARPAGRGGGGGRRVFQLDMMADAVRSRRSRMSLRVGHEQPARQPKQRLAIVCGRQSDDQHPNPW